MCRAYNLAELVSKPPLAGIFKNIIDLFLKICIIESLSLLIFLVNLFLRKENVFSKMCFENL